MNICEIKYAREPYTISAEEENRLMIRQQNFRMETETRQGIQLSFITPYGVNNNSHKANVVSEVTLDDLFS